MSAPVNSRTQKILDDLERAQAAQAVAPAANAPVLQIDITPYIQSTFGHPGENISQVQESLSRTAQQLIGGDNLSQVQASLSRAVEQLPPLKPSSENATRESLALTMARMGTTLLNLKIQQTLCWSSCKMADLMTWRNKDTGIIKKVVTELALPLLTITSVIERLAYKALSLAAKSLSPITERLTKYVKEKCIDDMHISAKYTNLWTITSLYKNLKNVKLPENEFAVRLSWDKV